MAIIPRKRKNKNGNRHSSVGLLRRPTFHVADRHCGQSANTACYFCSALKGQRCSSTLQRHHENSQSRSQQRNKPVIRCRTLTPPTKTAEISTLVEDVERSRIMRVSLYNCFPASLSQKNIIKCLPVGTDIEIENPMIQCTSEGTYVLQCHDPRDVTVLEQTGNPQGQEINDHQCNNSNENNAPIPRLIIPMKQQTWAALGDKYAEEENYDKAIAVYSAALKRYPSNIDLLLKRSFVYYKISAFSSSFADIEKITDISPRHIPANCLAAQILRSMQMYNDALLALEFVHSFRLTKKKKKQIVALIEEVKALIAQEETGVYDIAFMITTSNESGAHHFDYAEFAANIEIGPTNGRRGKGFFAAETLIPGQLVLASKAFASVFVANNTEHGQDEIDRLVAYVAETLNSNADKKKSFRSYAGLESNEGAEDIVLNEAIVECICNANYFEGDCGNGKVKGLWMLPSYFNHSCFDCNCTWSIYGDFMFVRAFKRIACGEEILISYVSPDAVYSERQKMLDRYGITCDCRLCQVDRRENEDIHLKRDKVLKNFRNSVHETENPPVSNGSLVKLFDGSSGSCDPKLLQAYINELEYLRPYNPDLNLHIASPLYHLALSQYKRNESLEAVEALEYAFRLLEVTPLCNQAFHFALNIVHLNLSCRKRKEAKVWFQKTKQMCEAYFGSCSILSN